MISGSRSTSRVSPTTSRSTMTTSQRSSPTERGSWHFRSRRTRLVRRPMFLAWSSSRTPSERSRGRMPFTTRRTGRSTSRRGTSTSSSARRTSTSGRTWGSRREARVARVLARLQGSARRGRAGRTPVRAGTSQHELLAGFVAAVDYISSLGWDALLAHERALGSALPRRAPGERGAVRDPRHGRTRSHVCFNVPGHSAERVAVFLAEREIAVWNGDYYAVETMKHLGLADGAVRAGIVHYNTEDEVDRLLEGPRRARVKLLLLGGPRFLGRAIADAGLERGHELTFFNRGLTSPELYPEVGASSAIERKDSTGREVAIGTRWWTRAATSRATCRRRQRRSSGRASIASSRASRCTRTSARRRTRTVRSPTR